MGDHLSYNPTPATDNSTGDTHTAQGAATSGTAASGPTPGLYLFGMFIEVTTAGAAGTLTGTVTATGAGGSNTQTVIASLVLTAKKATSGLALVYIESGDITYATTWTGVLGNPIYDVRTMLLGKLA